MLSEDKFAELFSALCEAFEKKPSRAYSDLYYSVLQDLTAKQFENAVKQVLSNRKYSKMPLPAEILEWVFGDPEDRAIKAAQQIEQAMIHHGGWYSVVFADNVINHVVASHGWRNICAVTDKEWPFLRRELIKSYMSFERVRTRLTPIDRIPGQFEITNTANNNHHPSQEVICIDESIIGILPESSKQIKDKN